MQVKVTINLNDTDLKEGDVSEEQFEDDIVSNFDDWVKGLAKDYPNWTSAVVVFVREEA